MNKPVILCVDEDAAALAVRRLVLMSAGYTVFTATDGMEALDLFRTVSVDVVIMDHLVAGLPGTQIGAEMRRLRSTIPIILFRELPDAPPGSKYADLFSLPQGGLARAD